MRLMAFELVDLDRQGIRMKIIFVRHGEPDYSMLDKLENPQLYSGFGRDLAPLTGKGRSLAKEVAKTACFGKAEIIISSSVTRALETAHYIAVETGLDLFVEPFFHEWRPDLDGTNSDLTSVLVAHEYYLKHQGSLPEDSPYRYETALEMRHRFLRTLEKYKNYKTIIIVTHGMLMRQFVPNEKIDFCQVIECEIEI